MCNSELEFSQMLLVISIATSVGIKILDYLISKDHTTFQNFLDK